MRANMDEKRELFAQHYASGRITRSEAARRAGYAPSDAANAGSRLAREPGIIARLEELRRDPNAQKPDDPINPTIHFTSKPYIVGETISVHTFALKAKEFSVCVNCLRLLAQLGGHLSDGTGRNSSNAPNLTQVNISTMTAKELGEYLRDQVKSMPAADRKQLENVIDVDCEPVDALDDLP